MAITIYIDADACPVREETYKVAIRHNVPVVVVANNFLRVMQHPLISRIMVSDGFDAADNYIAEKANEDTIVITSDIPLADRCIKAGSRVLAPNGKPFTEDSIGSALAVRAIMQDVRAGAMGENVGGPPPFSARDRSTFLQVLHETVTSLKRS